MREKLSDGCLARGEHGGGDLSAVLGQLIAMRRGDLAYDPMRSPLLDAYAFRPGLAVTLDLAGKALRNALRRGDVAAEEPRTR